MPSLFGQGIPAMGDVLLATRLRSRLFMARIDRQGRCRARESLVARTGFEPVISGLKGRRPGPLDERAGSRIGIIADPLHGKPVVGGEGFEPPTSSMSSWRSPS